MTINAKEALIEQTNSAEVYIFTLGTTAYYRTSYFRTLIIDGQEYIAYPIQRSSYKISSDLSPAECSITMKVGDDLITKLLTSNGPLNLKVEINRYFLDNLTENKNLFTGYMVGDFSFTSGVCTMHFKDILYLLDNEICRVRLQSECNNMLFDSVCLLNSNTYKLNTSVGVDTTGKILTSANFASKVDGYYTLGKMRFNDSLRIITKHVGNTIYLHHAVDGLGNLDIIDVWPGCDKNPATCLSKFNNMANFVGMPFIPLKDPEQTAITNTVT